jgi:hypothetical protein
LVGVDEGQVDDVEHEVGQADGQDEQTLVLLFVAHRHIKAEGHAIKDADGDVGTGHAVDLELLLELTVAIVIE